MIYILKAWVEDGPSEYFAVKAETLEAATWALACELPVGVKIRKAELCDGFDIEVALLTPANNHSFGSAS